MNLEKMIDDCSREYWLKKLKNDSEVYEAIENGCEVVIKLGDKNE